MNTYYKFAPNVFLAKCDQEYQKNDVIKVVTSKGKENECIVFNLIGQKNGFYYYSIVRADGFNVQEWVKAAVIANLLDSLDNRQLKGLDEVIKEYIASVEKDIAEPEKQFEEL